MSASRGGRAGGNTAAAVLRRTGGGSAVAAGSQLSTGHSADQVAFTDQVYLPRPFLNEQGLSSKDNRPIVPVAKTEAQATRITASAKTVTQSLGASVFRAFQSHGAGAELPAGSGSSLSAATLGMWPPPAHPDDPRRIANGNASAAVPHSRFPHELSEMGRPLRRPKIKISTGAESRSVMRVAAAAAATVRRRQRETNDEDDEDEDDLTAKKKKRGGGGSGGASGGAAASAGGAAKKGGDDAASVPSGGSSRSGSAASSESDDGYSNPAASDDDEDNESGYGGGDDELAF